MSDSTDDRPHFHFTLGPVQAFVAQARRTRDFWAGSFILSWLSAVAMKAVEQQDPEHNNITFPAANKEFLAWVGGEQSADMPRPTQGVIPNRFMARVSADFRPDAVVDAVQKAWLAIADQVWAQDFGGPSACEGKTREIWDRQTKHFWEIAWVLTGPADADSAALDRRKTWRSHFFDEEGGVKCMVMDGLQELSGVPSPTDGHGLELKTFWRGVRKPKTAGIRSDLRAGEHLCAIAFIKRRFVRCFDDVSIDIGGMPVRGWSLKPGMPSAPFMAVVHWLKDAIDQAETDPKIGELYERFHKAAHELADTQPGGGYGEWESDIRCLRVATERRRWRSLDGDLFFDTALDNVNLYGDKDDPQINATIRKRAGEVKRCLHRLQGALGTRPPSPFYAVLLMDGDSLGVNLSDPKKQPVITEALDAFTKRVKGIVDEHNGFLVYAGGDDVLALLPLEDAMNCALRLRRCYLAAFDKRMDPRHPFAATISGAIEYAHVRMPLTKVFKDAQELLKHVAKAGRGRDALAVRVWKPGGKALEWALPWGIAFAQGPTGSDGPTLEIQALADKIAADDPDQAFSSGFFYRIRELFDLLNPAKERPTSDQNEIDEAKPVFDPATDEAEYLIAAEYVGSGLCDRIKPPSGRMVHARTLVEPLLRQCRPVIREANQTDPSRWPRDAYLHADGALLVRFLSAKGVEQ